MTDTAKVRVRRIGEEPVTAFSYSDPKNPNQMTTYVADAGEQEFDMTPFEAIAAVQSGGFEVHPDSKSPAEVQQEIAEAEAAEKAEAEEAPLTAAQ
jgi:hypothetical protein